MAMFRLILRNKGSDTNPSFTRDVEAGSAFVAGFIVGNEFDSDETDLIDCIRLS